MSKINTISIDFTYSNLIRVFCVAKYSYKIRMSIANAFSCYATIRISLHIL